MKFIKVNKSIKGVFELLRFLKHINITCSDKSRFYKTFNIHQETRKVHARLLLCACEIVAKARLLLNTRKNVHVKSGVNARSLLTKPTQSNARFLG